MIDPAMLARLMVQTETHKLNQVASLLPLAKLIWETAQKEEREACARAYKGMSAANLQNK